ncbi:MAG: arsenate reductase ArsC [Candidatus Eisenbacteria bacterium]|nr:arsenate reductase ArsC [Candidatus Eisenbacteria bacterium]
MREPESRPLILFLCTGNSCRSQMAEGWTRVLKGDEFEVVSAGTEPKPVDPRAVRAMAEAGVDISGQGAKSVDEFAGWEFDYVVTVCDAAYEACPFFPGKTKRVHAGFADPPKLAESAGSEEEALEHYRRIRDRIRAFVEAMPGSLEAEALF